MPAKRKTRNGAQRDAVVLPRSRKPRVLLLGDPAKPRTAELAREIREFLEPRARLIGVELARTLAPITYKPDLVIVLGGDGAMLAVSHRLGGRRVPVLGVNLGRVGFLAAVGPDRVLAVLGEVLAGRGQLESRALLRAKVKRGREVVLDTHILNEAVVMRTWGASMVEIALTVDRRSVCTYRGDGLIVSTATGSTAYSLAAGGPILSPRLDAFILTPIAPYALSQRPLVLPGARVTVLTVHRSAGFTADGHEEFVLQPGDQVRVGPSPRRLDLVVDPQANFFSRLRSKLHWAETPGSGQSSGGRPGRPGRRKSSS